MRPLHDPDGKKYEVVHTVDLSDEKLKDIADTLGIADKARGRLKDRKIHIVREAEAEPKKE